MHRRGALARSQAHSQGTTAASAIAAKMTPSERQGSEDKHYAFNIDRNRSGKYSGMHYNNTTRE
jgi:hypothetical protein